MLLAPLARAELDPGTRDYLVYTIQQNSTVIGYVLATATAGGGYAANREYWFMTANVSSRTAVTITTSGSGSWSSPPSGLGTLSFTMAQNTTWTRGTQSGVMHMYDAGGSGYIGFSWAMVETSGVWTGSITWWCTTGSGTVFTPDSQRIFSAVAGSGTADYIVSTPL